MKTRVLVADDHSVLRAGLSVLVNAEPDMEVIGEAADGFEAVRKALELNPDVVVMDVSMPGIDGLEATRQISAKRSGARILVLTIHEERGYLHRFLQAGASGYFVKNADTREIVAAIRAVARGSLAVHSSMLKYMTPTAEDTLPSAHEECQKLTERENQVVRLLVQGYTNSEIAERLVVSRKTIETHRANAMAKLGIRSRAELVQYAIQHGWLAKGG